MRQISVIILSKNTSNLLACVNAVRACDPDVDVVGINDGLDVVRILREGPMSLIAGEKPFIFSRNVNIGIRARQDNDIVVLNDDALINTPGGLRRMQRIVFERPDFGIIGATTNRVGNRNQWRIAQDGLREEPRSLCFICVFIPRTTIDKVGLLDEDYNCYSHQDDDYCYRVRLAGLRLGICDGCFVDHASLPSSFRDDPAGPGGELMTGQRIFTEKWGAYPL